MSDDGKSDNDASDTKKIENKVTINIGADESQELPGCALSKWSAAPDSIEGKYFNPSLLQKGIDFFKDQRIFLLLLESSNRGISDRQLHEGLINHLLKTAHPTGFYKRGHFDTKELDKFRGTNKLTISAFISSLSDIDNTSIIFDIMGTGRGLSLDLINSLNDHSHPSAMRILTDNLQTKNIRLLFIADNDLVEESELDISPSVHIEPLQAVKEEILNNATAKELSTERLDSLIDKELFGNTTYSIAKFLHEEFIAGNLATKMKEIDDGKQDPKLAWKEKVEHSLFIANTPQFEISTENAELYNKALLEVGKIILFLFQLFDELDIDEFEGLLKIITEDGKAEADKVILNDFKENETSEDADSKTHRALFRTVSAKLLNEYRQESNSLFRSLSIRQKNQSDQFGFEFPFMRDVAAELLREYCPTSSQVWFNNIVIDTPVIFNSSEALTRQLMEHYANWLAKKSPGSARGFSIMSWWGLAVKIVREGFEEVTKDLKDQNTRDMLSFLERPAARPIFISRVCMLFETFMQRQELEPYVAEAIDELIDSDSSELALDIVRTLQSHDGFDTFGTLIKIINCDNLKSREEAAVLLGRYLDKTFKNHQSFTTLIRRIKKHLPSNGELTLFSQHVCFAIIQSMTLDKSHAIDRQQYRPALQIAPMFNLENIPETNGLTPNIDIILDILLHEVDRDTIMQEAHALVEAVSRIWFNEGIWGTENVSNKVVKVFQRDYCQLNRENDGVIKGMSLAIFIIEAFHILKKCNIKYEGQLIDVLRAFMTSLGSRISVENRKGILKGARICISALTTKAHLQDRYETAVKLDRWAR